MIQILNKKQTKEIEDSLWEQFGVHEIPGRLFQLGEEKIFLFSGEASDGDIKELEGMVPVERLGVYFAKAMNGEIRLSIEGTQILKEQIKKNIFELDKEQAEKWMQGQELNIHMGKKGFFIMKYKNDFLGCGKASEEKIGNFIPKMRRLKNKLE